ncbi:MAG: P-loop NTPase fold protein [Bacteroidota bacterium]
MNLPDKDNTIGAAKSLIAAGKLEDAIDRLIEVFQYDDQDVYESLILSKASLETINKNFNAGIISTDTFQIERNKITKVVLEGIDHSPVDSNKLQVSEIKRLIAEDKLKESLNTLEAFYQEIDPNNVRKFSNEIIALKAQLRKLTSDTAKGVLSFNDENIRHNSIVKATLDLLDEIEQKNIAQEDFLRSSAEVPSKGPSAEEVFIPINTQLKRSNPDVTVDRLDEIADLIQDDVVDLYNDMKQVKPVFGDMFQANFDLMIIPKNENGNISPSMERGMSKMGYQHEYYLSKSGSIELLPEPSDKKTTGRVAYAISVEAENESNLALIEGLGRELGIMSLGAEGFKNIVSPLLGTGVGGLDKERVFQTLEKNFKANCDQDAKLFIYILDKEIFDRISQSKRDRFFKVLSYTRSRFDTDSVGGEDHLDVSHEVDSFANLIVSSELKPPLSIGLFGNWGTGKSFFMEKLFDGVKELSAKANLEVEDTSVCKNIVQIKFNAWYYIDANLWASMVSNIFEKLSEHLGIKKADEKQEIALYEQLASTQEQIKRAENEADQYSTEIKTLEEEIVRLKEERKKKRKTLEEVRLQHILEEMQKDSEVAKFMEKAKAKLGFAELEDINKTAQRSVSEVEGLIERYKSSQGRVLQVFKSIVSFNNVKAKALLLFFIVVPLIAYYSITQLDYLDNKPFLEFIGKIGTVVTGLTLFLRKMIDLADPILQNINSGVSYLNRAKSRLQNLQDAASSETTEEIAMLEHECDQLNEEHQKAIGQKWNAEKQFKLIKKEINEIKAGKRLDSFIQRRIENSDYQKHLGLISIVRKDFDKLSKYLQEHRNAEAVIETLGQVERASRRDENEKNNIDRIILYVDDLDRCPPDKVVDVLQAIHLILAFPLFVVVVGVDVRWVSKSLLKKYGKMLTSYDSDLSDDPELKLELQGSATPYDYLEKIFQIPFKLKNISDTDKKKYITKLLEKDLQSAENKVVDTSKDVDFQQAREVTNASTKTKEKTAESNPLVVQPTKENSSKKEEKKEASNSSAQQLPAATSQALKKGSAEKWSNVQLTKEEFDFVVGLSPIVGNSARTIKRYVNLARLIKSNKNWIPYKSVMNTKPYHACLFMLAIVVGSPWMFPLFFSLIREEEKERDSDRARTLKQLVQKKEIQLGKEIDKHGHINKEWDNLRVFLDNIATHENIDIRAINAYDLNYLREFAPIVSRFSFRVLEEVEVSNFLKQIQVGQ